VKAAVLSRARAEQADVHEILVHTGQHYDDNMSRVFFEELALPRPTYNLGIGPGGHGAQTGRMLEAIERILLAETPDWVLVFGDTNSTLAGAVAAAKLHVPVAHVEAGLRSFNRHMPEEINRVLTDHASDLLFAPTDRAVDNLHREGLPPERVRQVGDVMYDAALYYAAQAEAGSDVLRRLSLSPRGYLLATAHRAENTDEEARLRAIFRGLQAVAQTLPVVVPLHPRTRAALERCGAAEELTAGLQVTEPLGYLDMIMLEKQARLIATDSGGVQKEAYFFRVPCVTMREETEWVELVETGWNRLASPTSPEVIRAALEEAADTEGEAVELYGQGDAGRRIVREILAYARD
jgi:UDP-GlcNAc3NAcA epimerase